MIGLVKLYNPNICNTFSLVLNVSKYLISIYWKWFLKFSIFCIFLNSLLKTLIMEWLIVIESLIHCSFCVSFKNSIFVVKNEYIFLTIFLPNSVSGLKVFKYIESKSIFWIISLETLKCSTYWIGNLNSNDIDKI